MIRACVAAVGLCLAAAACTVPSIGTITSATLEADIAARGARAVVTEATSGDGALWNHILKSIGSGEPAWLALAPRLRPGTDGGTGEDLNGALGVAIASNPEAVLRLIGAAFPVERVCGNTLIEPTPQQSMAYVEPRIAALSKVTDPRLLAVRDSCLAKFR